MNSEANSKPGLEPLILIAAIEKAMGILAEYPCTGKAFEALVILEDALKEAERDEADEYPPNYAPTGEPESIPGQVPEVMRIIKTPANGKTGDKPFPADEPWPQCGQAGGEGM